MNGSQITQLVILVLLLCLSAFFSSAETAFTTVNKIYMRTLAQDGDARAERVLQITENSGKMLSAILIGNNVVNLSASSLATTLAIGMFGRQMVTRWPGFTPQAASDAAQAKLLLGPTTKFSKLYFGFSVVCFTSL